MPFAAYFYFCRTIQIRNNVLENIRYLVFDELHTYRGRQGSDVSMLIRRIKASAKNKITCFGTSATMVSSDKTTLLEQKQEVAKVGSLIFGSDITYDQIIYEHLVRSIGKNVATPSEVVAIAIKNGIDQKWTANEFENHATANWLEENIAGKGICLP
jgi:ATP-dependent helicase YprA (DUF1998 family)